MKHLVNKLVPCLALIACATQQLPASADSDFRPLYEPFDVTSAPGLAVAVIKDDNIAFAEGFGSANLEYDIPIGTDTVFHVASISKQFTAFAILKLEQEGLLSIEDDVRQYLPEVPDFGHTIRLKHLLTHSSGLREQWRLLEMAGWRLDDVITNEHVLTLVQDQTALNFEPGTRYMYCNTGFTLLAEVVERVTGQTFADYTQAQIFEPLGMTDSLFYDDHEAIVRNRAYSYEEVEGALRKRRLNFAVVGPTGLFTTVSDMSRWAMNFNEPKIGNPDLFDRMSRMSQRPDGSTVSYAMGQFVGSYKGHDMISHAGSDAGYRAYFARFPAEGLSVVLLANSADIDARKETYKAVDLALDLSAGREPANAPAPLEAFAYDDDLLIEVTAEQLAQYEGSYWDPEDNAFRTTEVRQGKLIYSGREGEAIALLPVGEGQFKLPGTPYDVSVNFKVNDQQDPIMEIHVPDVMWLWLLKVQKTGADGHGTGVDPYTGTYASEELGTSYELRKIGNDYALSHQRLGVIPLTQIHAGLFTSDNRNFRQVRFFRDADDQIAGFSVKNEGINALAFQKTD